MAWMIPQHNRGRVDAAGKLLADHFTGGLVDPSDLDAAFSIIGNWRSSHSFPLQNLKMVLLKRGKRIDPMAVIAQRLKRSPSIALKLALNSNMKLSQMQDIGGCRAVVGNISD